MGNAHGKHRRPNRRKPHGGNGYPILTQTINPGLMTNSGESNHLQVMPSAPKQGIKVRALFTIIVENIGDLRFNKGDILIAFSNLSDQWIYAKNTVTNEVGYVPCNYVVVDDGSPASHDSWFDIGRTECEKKLIHPGYSSGTYILRPSTHCENYALSVRYCNVTQNIYEVKHYKIRVTDDEKYYIGNQIKFADIKSLIDHYSKESSGLCCSLSDPFPKHHKPPLHFREIEINRECIVLQKKLGNGSFGDVWLGKWNNTVEVAVKMLKQNSLQERATFLEEAKLMHKLYHPRIVEILGVCSEPSDSPVYIITELMVQGSLLTVLYQDEGKTILFKDLILMMNQIADGMGYLESKNFIHRDLRAANILVGEDISVKVADFGLSREVQDDYIVSVGSKFPIKWTAPEAGLRRKFSIKSDVWSFGVLMYEMVTYGGNLYPGMENKSVLLEVEKGYRMPNPRSNRVKCPPQLYSLMMSCWDALPDNRPTFRYLKELFDDFSVSTEDQYESDE